MFTIRPCGLHTKLCLDGLGPPEIVLGNGADITDRLDHAAHTHTWRDICLSDEAATNTLWFDFDPPRLRQAVIATDGGIFWCARQGALTWG
jgi:hypothetical protein